MQKYHNHREKKTMDYTNIIIIFKDPPIMAINIK